MSGNNRKNKQKTNVVKPANETNCGSIRLNKIKKFFRNGIVQTVTGGLILLLIQNIAGTTKKYSEIPGKLEKIETQIENQTITLSEMHDSIEELQTIHTTSGDMIRMDLSPMTISSIALKSDGLLVESIRSQEYTNSMDVYLNAPSWSAEEVVATGIDGTEYKAYSLYNTRIIFTYTEDGQDIVFAGSINGNNNWDGNCIVNVYKEGKFVIATEADYEDGVRKYYEKLFSDGNKWVYSERYIKGNSNSGDTWKYRKEEEINCQIDFSDPKEENMITPREFIIPIGRRLASHYHGDTSDGKYNDLTDQAYYVSYDEYANVLTVYKGRFSNGLFNDDTGDAWYITRENSQKKDMNYQYYKGDFVNGHPVPVNERKSNSVFDNMITIEEAERIVINERFFDEIKWDERRFYQDDQQ